MTLTYLRIIAIILVILGLSGSYILDDPHIFSRFGAIISGVAALFVVAQIVFELRIESEKDEIFNHDNHSKQTVNANSLFLPPHLISRVSKKIEQSKIDELHIRRLNFVKTISIIAFAGEIIHGWGDIIYKIGEGATIKMSYITYAFWISVMSWL